MQIPAGQTTRNPTSDRFTQTEAITSTSSGSQLATDTNASTNSAPQVPSNAERLSEAGRVARAERERLRHQKDHDTA